MQLKEINPNIFQHNKEINYDVSQLYFDYGDKKVFDLLKQSITNNIFSERIKVKPTANYWTDINNFHYMKNEEISKNHYHFYFTLINSLSEKEKEVLLDIALAQPPEQRRFASILIKNPEIKITQNQFNNIFHDKHPYSHSLKQDMVANKNIEFTTEQINEGLLNWNSGLSVCYAKRGERYISHETMESLINETNKDSYHNEDVLIELLKHKNMELTNEQIEFFLTNENFMLKVECARNYQLSFTENQIERGLKDSGFEYEAYDDKYDGYHPSDVVNAFINNPNIKLSEETINNIVYGHNEYVNMEDFVQKEKLNLTEAQISVILEKNDRSSVLLLKNKNIHLNDHQLIKSLYRNEHWPKYLAQYYLNREDVTVSEVVFSVLKISPSLEIKKVIEERSNNILEKIANNKSTIKHK